MKYTIFKNYISSFSVCAMFFLCFIGCARGHEIDCGIVVEKRFKPKRIFFTPIHCGKTIYFQPHIVPSQYILIVRDDNKTDSFFVSHNTYDCANIGDSISFKEE